MSPTCAGHVAAEFGDEVDFILDGGWCSVGLESTIVDLTGAAPRVLRVGSVTLADIMAVLGEQASAEEAAGPTEAVKVPGSHLKHYSPETPLCLVPAEELSARVEQALGLGRRVGVIARTVAEDARVASAGEWASMPEDAEGYGRLLYATMRDLDGSGCEVILVETPPVSLEWEVVIDRLTRAASGGHCDE
ncbi:MAG: Sua5/YciO/YrdC/YwlC family protein [Actinobacteria bacterium]|nr:Sua5/YciO/YrdC/YwlC family protein [Actinomycetota bacterium]